MIDEIIEHQFHQKEPSTSTSSSADHFDKNNLLLDALTQTTMLELMKTRKFKELWANMALLEQQEGGQSIEDEVANSNRTQSEGLSHSSIHFDPSNVGESIPQRISTPPSTNPLLIKTFRQLNQGLAFAIETFIRGAQMAISCTSPVVRTFNQDAAQLYSVRIQLDRFTGCSHFRTAQFGLIVRGLLKLFKLFTTYISSPYFIENAHFFANGLLEMLAQFLEYISLFDEIDQCMDAHLFCQKIEDFEKIICQPLKRMLLKRQLRAKNSSSKSQKCFSKSIQCLDLAVKDSRVILLPLHHDTSPPAAEGNRSFLMAPELEYGRRKMFISGNISRRLKSIMREERRINIDEGNKPRNLTFRPSLSGKEREEFRNACKMAEEAIGEVSKYIER